MSNELLGLAYDIALLPFAGLEPGSSPGDVLTWTGVNWQSLPTGVGGGLFLDSAFELMDNVDMTKRFKIEVSNVSTTTTRTLVVPDSNSILPVLNGTNLLAGGVSYPVSGVNNTAFGVAAGAAITTGSRNTAMGANTLDANTTGSDNTAFGYNAAGGLSTGIRNTAYGSGALAIDINGNNNSAFGYNAMTNSGGSDNTAMGANALSTLAMGTRNVAVGVDALATFDADDNTAVGYQSSRNAINGAENASFGGYSLFTNMNGIQNTALGIEALYTTTASANTAAGYQSLTNLTTGINNTAVGHQAGTAMVTGSNNVFFGKGSNTSGGSAGTISETINIGSGATTQTSQSTALGYNATASGMATLAVGHAVTASGIRSVSLGYQAIASSTGAIAFGSNNGAGSTAAEGVESIAFGVSAKSGTGSACIAMGSNAGSALNTGDDGIAFGRSSGQNALANSRTISIGRSSNAFAADAIAFGSFASAGGVASIALGPNAKTGSGSECMSVGNNAGSALSTGARTMAFGGSALDANTSGADNVAFGRDSLTTNTTGSFNTAFGNNSGMNVSTGSNNTLLGYGADVDSGTASNRIVLGSGAIGLVDNSLTINSIRSAATTADGLYYNIVTKEVTYGPAGISSSGFVDDVFRITDNIDSTRKLAFEVSNVATATVRTITMPNADVMLPGNFAATSNIILGQTTMPGGFVGTNTAILGAGSGGALTTGHNNTILGAGSGVSLTGGHNNTILGAGSGVALTMGRDNILLGRDVHTDIAGRSNTIVIGIHDTSVGFDGSMVISPVYVRNNITAHGLYYDTATGEVTYGFTSGGNEVADSFFRVVDNADTTKKLAFEVTNVTTNTTRTASVPDTDIILPGRFGSSTNLFVGPTNIPGITGHDNMGFGNNSLETLTTGNRNIAFGNLALANVTDQTDNVAIGHRAAELYGIVAGPGGNHTAVGSGALRSATNCFDNVAIGSGAMAQATTAASNTAVGTIALDTLLTGHSNTALGRYADVDNPARSGCVILGAGANSGIVKTSADGELLIQLVGGGNGAIKTDLVPVVVAPGAFYGCLNVTFDIGGVATTKKIPLYD